AGAHSGCTGGPMIAADRPIQRRGDARLLVVSSDGRMIHARRSRFVEFLHAGDLVIANDAATLPASLHGVHEPVGAEIEVRLAGYTTNTPDPPASTAASVQKFSAVVFGAGDFRTRT